MTGTEGQARKLCIDLCSGLGGFSQAFVDAGWEVITVDIEPKFNPTICMDVRGEAVKAELWGKSQSYEEVVMLASPPCERFSVASHAWPKKGIQSALEIVGACLEAIAWVKPDYWLMENPKGRLRWLLGTPRMTVRLCDYGSVYRKLTDLWGNIPLPMVSAMKQHTYYVETEIDSHVGHPLPRLTNDRAKKAKMPYGLSQAILEAVS